VHQQDSSTKAMTMQDQSWIIVVVIAIKTVIVMCNQIIHVALTPKRMNYHQFEEIIM